MDPDEDRPTDEETTSDAFLGSEAGDEAPTGEGPDPAEGPSGPLGVGKEQIQALMDRDDVHGVAQGRDGDGKPVLVVLTDPDAPHDPIAQILHTTQHVVIRTSELTPQSDGEENDDLHL